MSKPSQVHYWQGVDKAEEAYLLKEIEHTLVGLESDIMRLRREMPAGPVDASPFGPTGLKLTVLLTRLKANREKQQELDAIANGQEF